MDWKPSRGKFARDSRRLLRIGRLTTSWWTVPGASRNGIVNSLFFESYRGNSDSRQPPDFQSNFNANGSMGRSKRTRKPVTGSTDSAPSLGKTEITLGRDSSFASASLSVMKAGPAIGFWGSGDCRSCLSAATSKSSRSPSKEPGSGSNTTCG